MKKVATWWFDHVARTFLGELPSVEAQDEALMQFELLAQAFKKDSQIRDAFVNATHSFEARARLLKKVLEKQGVPSLVIHTVLLLMREQKLSSLDPFIVRLKKMRDELGLARQVELLVAEPFAVAMHQALHATLEKKWKTHVRLEERTDPSLLGGFELRTDDWHFDASVKGKLRRLKATLIAETL